MILCHPFTKPLYWSGLDWNQLQYIFTNSAPGQVSVVVAISDDLSECLCAKQVLIDDCGQTVRVFQTVSFSKGKSFSKINMVR